jgi:DNA repair exonuclease SbcCD ATPase subunit
MRRHFFQSPHHAILAASTLGVGFATGEPLYFILGAAAYVLGWVYVPDLGFFKKWVEKREAAAQAAAAAGELASFHAKRDAALRELSQTRRQRYQGLAEVCRMIERSIESPDDPRVKKLEELMWTYLRLLGMEQSLDHFLELELRENVAGLLEAASAEVARVEAEVEELRAEGSPALSTRERLLESRRQLESTLRQRAERLEQARQNLELVVAEQERLDQQIKLLRADAIAVKGATALSARIDATVEQLAATNAWLREMDEFRAAIGEAPLPGQRVGFGEGLPPPLPTQRTPAAAVQKNPGQR